MSSFHDCMISFQPIIQFLKMSVKFYFHISFQIIREAYDDFQKDLGQIEGREKQDDMHRFFNTPPNTQHGTTGYIAKAVVKNLLDGDLRHVAEDMCCLS